eukprot:2308853-Pyramimonas_sp.AAC.1
MCPRPARLDTVGASRSRFWKSDDALQCFSSNGRPPPAGAVFDGEPFNLSAVARAASRLACQIHALVFRQYRLLSVGNPLAEAH